MNHSSLAEVVAAIKAGSFAIVADDETRENEGDLIISAALAKPADLAFMVRYTSGIICASLEPVRAKELDLDLMVENNQESMRTAFTVTVDAARGVSTGVSAADRACTANLLASQTTVAADLVRPGHIFPLIAKEGGVKERPGHTEAAVDLMRLAGLPTVGLLSEIANDDGSMAAGAELVEFAEKHAIPMITVAEIAAELG